MSMHKWKTRWHTMLGHRKEMISRHRSIGRICSFILILAVIGTFSFPLKSHASPSLDTGSQWKSRHLLSVSSDNSSANSTFKEHVRHCELELQGLPGLWVAFYFFLIIVSFTALAIVCDDFFVPSLEIISEKLDLSEDVAGATFMAAGSSAPELFTSIVGLATDNNDVGVGTIAGSAMFNILIIIALSAALAGQVLYLDWRPLIRDSIFYATSVGVFIVFAWDGKLEHYETAILLFLYILYIVLMKFNIQVMEWMAGWNFCPCLCRPVIVPTVEDTAAGTQDSEDDIHNHKSATLQSGDLRKVLYLDWRPLIRDSIFYATSVGVFIVFAWDGKLEHYETAILLFLYILYIVLMKFNIQVMEWMAGWNFCPCLCRPVIVPTVEDTAAGTQDSEDDIHNHKSATLQSGDLRKLSMAGGHARRLSIISGRSNPDTHHDKHFHHVHHGSLSGNFSQSPPGSPKLNHKDSGYHSHETSNQTSQSELRSYRVNSLGHQDTYRHRRDSLGILNTHRSFKNGSVLTAEDPCIERVRCNSAVSSSNVEPITEERPRDGPRKPLSDNWTTETETSLNDQNSNVTKRTDSKNKPPLQKKGSLPPLQMNQRLSEVYEMAPLSPVKLPPIKSECNISADDNSSEINGSKTPDSSKALIANENGQLRKNQDYATTKESHCNPAAMLPPDFSPTFSSNPNLSSVPPSSPMSPASHQATKRLSVVYSSSSHSTTVRPSVHHTEPPIPEADSEENGMKPGSPNEGSIVEIEPEMYIFPCLPPLKMAPPDSSEAKEKGGCWLWSKFILKWVLFVISFPFVVLFTWSIPDCSKDHLKKWFWFSFLMSVVWIGLLSYAMIVVVERMGCILEIDTFVMGLVFIAIGTSVPDAMSSILVARDGYGDMAVSNAIGSNVFDINLGIGLPFLIKVIIQSGAPVYLVQPGETFLYIVPHVKFGFLLLLVLLITLGVFMGSKFVLNKFIGFSFVGVYVLFLTYAFIQELICRKQLNTFC
ncbi:uncharacterized protein LOC106179451 [Lingula anatina]|uniref:Uncharacterized protein LOC106179451 n=1 Tax=Lingula anatina TaxID=7574 RepID=A0A1S3K7D0_LINAN|nr:uncharacterized protein LOC106179451 [Lingula anatina]|eukprot:XP_013418533.1 uncharacterized protein LOC106179451 [Lingula anatina]